MATARSNPMTVPRNPDTIRGPCSRVSCAMDGGTFQPRRARPASTPAASEANPRIRSGSLNGTPRSLERMRGGPSGAARRYAANANPPHIRTAFQVFPAELAAVFGLELVIERLGVVVIDQEQGFARSQFGEGAEYQWMAVTRNNGADIDGVLGGCGHDRSPDVGEGASTPTKMSACVLAHLVRAPWWIPYQFEIDFDAGGYQRRQCLLGVIENHLPHRAGRCGHGQIDMQPVCRNFYAVYQTKINDVHPDFGVDDAAQHGSNFLFSDYARWQRHHTLH